MLVVPRVVYEPEVKEEYEKVSEVKLSCEVKKSSGMA